MHGDKLIFLSQDKINFYVHTDVLIWSIYYILEILQYELQKTKLLYLL